jgi:hypothetical protein
MRSTSEQVVPIDIHRLAPSAVFAPFPEPSANPPVVRALAFHRDGNLLVMCVLRVSQSDLWLRVCGVTCSFALVRADDGDSADSDGEVVLVDVVTGTEKKRTLSKKYPVGLCAFTHHPSCILCTNADSRCGRRSLERSHFVF